MKYLLLIFSLAIGIGNNTMAQWELLAPLDTVPAHVYCKFFNDGTGVVCSGGYGPDLQLIKTWDYGETWDTIYTNDGFFSDIDFVNEMIGYLCTYEGPVLKTTDGGYTWNNVNLDSSLEFTFQNMYFLNENVGFGTWDGNGGVWQTTNGGLDWIQMPNSTMGLDLFALDECNTFSAGLHHFHKRNDCEQEWNSFPYFDENISLYDGVTCFMFNPQSGLVGGNWNILANGSFISRTEDGGETWIPVVLNEFGGIYGEFEFISTDIGYAGGSSMQSNPYALLKTTDAGITWGYQILDFYPSQIEEYGTLSLHITSISCPSGSDTCYAVGVHGGIWRTFNGGGPTQSLPVSVSEHHALPKTLNLYPNPSSSIIKLDVSDAKDVREVSVYNSTGQLIQHSYASTQELHVAQWAPGCYTVVVRYENELVRSKFVVE